MSTLSDSSAASTTRVVLVAGEDPRVRRDAEERLQAAGFIVEVLCASQDKLPETVERAAAGLEPRVVIALMPSDSRGSALRTALRSGATGIVLEDRLAESLVATARAAAAGQLAMP